MNMVACTMAERSTGECFCVNAANLLQVVVVGEIVFLHFLYEYAAKSQLCILSSFSDLAVYLSYGTLNILPGALPAYLCGCVM